MNLQKVLERRREVKKRWKLCNEDKLNIKEQTKMKEKDKVLQALCDGLGENYKLMEIDLELCIYRDFGNRFEVEVSGVKPMTITKEAGVFVCRK